MQYGVFTLCCYSDVWTLKKLFLEAVTKVCRNPEREPGDVHDPWGPRIVRLPGPWRRVRVFEQVQTGKDGADGAEHSEGVDRFDEEAGERPVGARRARANMQEGNVPLLPARHLELVEEKNVKEKKQKVGVDSTVWEVSRARGGRFDRPTALQTGQPSAYDSHHQKV